MAAAAIVILHIEQFKDLNGLPNGHEVIVKLRMAVTLFFALSGFLITYLLLAEKQASGTIQLGRFYARRALRIWPVYYLVIFLGFAVIPHFAELRVPGSYEHVGPKYAWRLVAYLALLGNLALAMFRPVPYVSQTWSIGTEEQFYLVWPVLFKFVRRPLFVMLLLIGGIALARNTVKSWASPQSEYSWEFFLSMFQLGSMAVGGIMAKILFEGRQNILRIIFHPATQIASLGVLGWIITMRVTVPFIAHEIHALLFGCLIINAAANPRALFRPRARWLAAMGKWSYGIYMYHPLAIGLGLWFCRRGLGLSLETWASSIVLYAVVGGLTLAGSWLSYRAFETPFLRLKYAFAAKYPASEAAPKDVMQRAA